MFNTKFPITSALVADMVNVPAGDYLLRSRNATIKIKPGHSIGRTAVTVAAYREFCDAVGIEMPPAPSWGWEDDNPIVNVSWYDARRFCAWAAAVTGEDIDLPKEDLWEAAAGGPTGLIYPWGNEWDSSKCVNADTRTRSVESHPEGASFCGALNMAGNTWEWTLDKYKAR